MGNPHFATMVVDGKITRVRRDFIGGVILDVFHDDFV